MLREGSSFAAEIELVATFVGSNSARTTLMGAGWYRLTTHVCDSDHAMFEEARFGALCATVRWHC